QLRSQRSRELLHNLEIVLLADASPDTHNHLRRSEIDRARSLAERLTRLGANLRRINLRSKLLHLARSRRSIRRVCAEASRLHRHKAWPAAHVPVLRIQLPAHP